ncbi:MAG: recombinase family protein [Planctomycetia bacterium]|nr:recombinase family protein [Planctomycetia bacterium]
MTRTRTRQQAPADPRMRCAIYTRKSTEEGLDQEYNTLDAQRDSGEAYIKSQAQEGWQCLPDRYDDGGFTGGNMDRPALRRLMADIEAGRVDCVVVYKVDRLSRSLLDFARMMETFEKHHVSCVSVTQQFNTTNSMGRLMLNVLLSFAQFEREIISERTRDKIAATRRKGKWSGGMPLLGYDVDPRGSRLMVNEDEAVRVRAIFELYLDRQAMLPVIQELDRRGWVNKRWTTRKGHDRGGKQFTKTSLYKLLTNVTYLGKITYKEEVHDGEHTAIVSTEIWQRVQALLRRNGRAGGAPVRDKFGALLKGLLHCVPCNCAMSPTHCTRNGTKRYRYYVCTNAQKRGWGNCPSKSIPAPEIERFVVDQIKRIGRDPTLLSETVAQAQQQGQTRVAELETEHRGLERELGRWNSEVRDLLDQIAPNDGNTPATARLADLQERIRVSERRATEVREQVIAPREQARVVRLLVERVDYDGTNGKATITFHPSGIKTLADELAVENPEEHA